MKTTELLAPAGNLNKLVYALAYGADAVYCGLPDFSLRYRVNDFTYTDLREARRLTLAQGKKLYLTVNIFPHLAHLKKLASHVEKIKKIGADALIVSDPGIISYIKEVWPEVAIHLSTQANCTNWRTAKFWFEQGVSRVILARETSLKDIKEIHKQVPKLELEVFVHGAMCMSYSGRCLLSSWFTDRSANLGDCTQPCRWKYNVLLEEKERPGNYFPVEEDANGTYIMNSKDLCLIEHIDKLKKAGVCSFKIEGRAKSIYYLGNTIKNYRTAIDNPKADKKKLLKELQKMQNRGYTTGFVFGEKAEQRFDSSQEKAGWEFCGEVVENEDRGIVIRVHNQIKLGDKIEFIPPQGEIFSHLVKGIIDEKGTALMEAHGGQDQRIILSLKKIFVPKTLLRVKLKEKVE